MQLLIENTATIGGSQLSITIFSPYLITENYGFKLWVDSLAVSSIFSHLDVAFWLSWTSVPDETTIYLVRVFSTQVLIGLPNVVFDSYFVFFKQKQITFTFSNYVMASCARRQKYFYLQNGVNFSQIGCSRTWVKKSKMVEDFDRSLYCQLS